MQPFIDALTNLAQSTRFDPQQEVALVLLLAFLPLPMLFTFRARAGHRVTLRSIEAFETIKALPGRALETGQSIHLSLGIRGVGGESTAETLAGLAILEHLIEHAALGYVRPLVTVADATALPLAQDTLRRGYARHGYPDREDPTRVRFIAPDPVAYAVGVTGILEQENLAANVMVGTFGDEYLLMGEPGARRPFPQIVGTVNPNTLAFVYATADQPLFGEEIFAAGAYLSERPSHLGSLRAQDGLRWLLVLIIVGGVIWASLGLPSL